MSQEEVEKFLGRLLTEDVFRQKAAKTPVDACRNEGYVLSAEELAAIRGEDSTRFSLAA